MTWAAVHDSVGVVVLWLRPFSFSWALVGDAPSGPTGTYVGEWTLRTGLVNSANHVVIGVIGDRFHTFCEIAYKKRFSP